MDDWTRFNMFHAGILCCAGVQINILTFCVEFFRSLVDHSKIFMLSFIGIYICTTIGFPIVLVLPTLMSAKPVEIGDMTFFTGSVCSHRSYMTVNHSTFKTFPKISNSDFYPNLNF